MNASITKAAERDVFGMAFHPLSQPWRPDSYALTTTNEPSPADSTSARIHFDGYAFDESFLTMPVVRPSSAASSQQGTAQSFTPGSRGRSNSSSRGSHVSRYSGKMSSSPTALGSPTGECLIHEPFILLGDATKVFLPGTPTSDSHMQSLDELTFDGCHDHTPGLSAFPSVATDEQAQDSSASGSDSQLVRQQTHDPYPTNIAQEPSLNFCRATWWDYLLQTYNTRSSPLGSVAVTRNLQDSSNEISQDVCRFFKLASIYLHFINAPRFFDMFHHAELRGSIQPALILSILAQSKLLEFYIRDGKCDEEGERLWGQSIMLRDLAQAAFDASYNAGWIDLPLAQAAWILLLYEISAHRDSSAARKEAALVLLDNIIRVLKLTTVDIADPRAPRFAVGAVPALGRPNPVVLPRTATATTASNVTFYGSPCPRVKPLCTDTPTSTSYQVSSPPVPFDMYVNNSSRGSRSPPRYPATFKAALGCPCHALSLAKNPETVRSTPVWSTMPGWGHNMSDVEICKEQARRLVWSAVTISTADAATRLANGYQQLDLHVARPENFAVLYPGEEALSREPEISTQYSGKESTWALLGRSALLFRACVQELPKIRVQPGIADFIDTSADLQAVSDFEMRAWVEVMAIEDALDAHTCNIEQSTLYQARDYTLTVRLLLSGGFLQSMPPLPRAIPFARIDYDNAIQWLQRQTDIKGKAYAVMMSDHDNPLRQLMTSRPFLTSWAISQTWRCVELWKLENSLTLALDVALGFVPLLRFFEVTWPCSEERRQSARLFHELTTICAILDKKFPDTFSTV
ncbi:hypothetical protein FRB93_007619 [Tulasnella sp. JGI-2019a]|nr:hypothetical protein FRB93_007619 [Tulasnella sp. JGI-2019a]